MIPLLTEDDDMQQAITSTQTQTQPQQQQQKRERLSHSKWMIVGFMILCIVRVSYLSYGGRYSATRRQLGQKTLLEKQHKHEEKLLEASLNHDFSDHSCEELNDRTIHELLSNEAMCDFAKTCNDGDGIFAPIVFCHDDDDDTTSPTTWMLLLSFPLILLLAVLFRILGSTAEEFFSPGLETFSLKLGFPERFAGVTLLALGNGAPDVASTVSAVINDRKRGYLLALGELTGAAMVASTLIVGVVIYIAQGVSCRSALIRDVLVFVVTMAVVFRFFQDGTITRREVHIMVGIYVAYCIIVLACDLYQKHKRRHVVGRAAASCCTMETDVVEEDTDNILRKADLNKATPTTTAESTPLLLKITGSNNPKPTLRHVSSSDSVGVERLIEAISNYSDCSQRDCEANDDEPLMVFHPHHGGMVDLKHHDLNPQDDTPSTTIGPTPESWSEAFVTGKQELMDHFVKLWDETLGTNSGYSRIEKVLMGCEMPFTILRMLSIPVPCDGYYCRPLVALAVTFAPLWMWYYCHAQFGTDLVLVVVGNTSTGSGSGSIGASIAVILIPSSILGLLVLRYAPSGPIPMKSLYASIPLTLIGFTISATWLDLIADKLVSLLSFFGVMFHIPSTIMGLTILAWGNASQDLIANMTVAKKGLSAMAITASFAGPVFNILVGLGIGLTILLKTNPEEDGNSDEGKPIIPVELDNTLRIGFGFCILNGILVIVAGTCIGRGRIPKRFGFFAMTLYAVYAVASVLA